MDVPVLIAHPDWVWFGMVFFGICFWRTRVRLLQQACMSPELQMVSGLKGGCKEHIACEIKGQKSCRFGSLVRTGMFQNCF